MWWCYPVVVLAYAVLPERRATAYGLALLLGVAIGIIHGFGVVSAAPFAISLIGVLLALARMVRRHRDIQRTLADQTITDPLTGAFNRRHLDACLAMAIQRRNRASEPAALLVIDIDHFKAINDALGHAAGDLVLQGLVALLRGRMRSIDAVFRTGGEEFALLLAGARYADALIVAEDLRLMVGDSALLETGRISVSVGVCELHRGHSPAAWLADADQALYRAKRSGRDRVAGRPLASVS